MCQFFDACSKKKEEKGEENAWLENKDMANNFFVVLIYEYYY